MKKDFHLRDFPGILAERFRQWVRISFHCVQIYTHPRISQRDFPVMRFVKRNPTETKDKKTLGKHMKGPIGKASAIKRKEMQIEKEKKDVGSSCL